MIKDKSKSAEKSKAKEKNHQQILFAENELSSPEKLLTDVEQQIIFDNQDWLPVEQENDNVLENELDGIAVVSKPRWAWRIIFSLSAVMLVVEAINFFIVGFTSSPISTSIYGAIFTTLAFVSGSALLKELSGLRQLKQQNKVKQDALAIYQDESAVDVKALCEQISAKLPGDLLSDAEESKWQDILSSQYSDEELLHLYEKIVLAKVDQKALDEIATFSTEAVALVALSPVAIIDMLIILWRNLRMINKISGLYGLKLGYWSRIKLIKQVFINMAYAGASELVADLGSEALSADLLGKLSARLGQGLGAGLLTARLGLKTMQACRPLPFGESRPGMGQMRREIANKIKRLIK
jgi:putative membrane protein